MYLADSFDLPNSF